MSERFAQAVIDQLIRENRPNEYMNYAFAILFVGLGTGAFIYSIVTGHWALSIGSAIETGLFYPAVNPADSYSTSRHCWASTASTNFSKNLRIMILALVSIVRWPNAAMAPPTSTSPS